MAHAKNIAVLLANIMTTTLLIPPLNEEKPKLSDDAPIIIQFNHSVRADDSHIIVKIPDKEEIKVQSSVYPALQPGYV